MDVRHESTDGYQSYLAREMGVSYSHADTGIIDGGCDDLTLLVRGRENNRLKL